jgi:hypothetical protein
VSHYQSTVLPVLISVSTAVTTTAVFCLLYYLRKCLQYVSMLKASVQTKRGHYCLEGSRGIDIYFLQPRCWKLVNGHATIPRKDTADLCWLCVHCVHCAKGKNGLRQFIYHLFSWISGITTHMFPFIWLYLERHERGQISCVVITVLPTWNYNIFIKVEELIGTKNIWWIGRGVA